MRTDVLEEKLKNVGKFRCPGELEIAILDKIQGIERMQRIFHGIKLLWLSILIVSVGYLVFETYDNLGGQFWMVLWLNKSVFLSNFGDFISMILSETSILGMTAVILSVFVYSLTASLSKLSLYRFKYE